MFNSKKERDFFYSWFFNAQSDSNFDPEKQFFYFYALFNHLFKSHAKENEDRLKQMGLVIGNNGKEKNEMRFYLFSLFYLDSEKQLFKDFNPFVMLRDCGKEKLIGRMKLDSLNTVFATHNLPDYCELENLFLVIYELRCDLFHGDVSLHDYDRGLYEEANMVLQDFLKRLFEANCFSVKN